MIEVGDECVLDGGILHYFTGDDRGWIPYTPQQLTIALQCYKTQAHGRGERLKRYQKLFKDLKYNLENT